MAKHLEHLHSELADYIRAKDDGGVRRIYRSLLNSGHSRNDVMGELIRLKLAGPGKAETIPCPATAIPSSPADSTSDPTDPDTLDRLFNRITAEIEKEGYSGSPDLNGGTYAELTQSETAEAEPDPTGQDSFEILFHRVTKALGNEHHSKIQNLSCATDFGGESSTTQADPDFAKRGNVESPKSLPELKNTGIRPFRFTSTLISKGAFTAFVLMVVLVITGSLLLHSAGGNRSGLVVPLPEQTAQTTTAPKSSAKPADTEVGANLATNPPNATTPLTALPDRSTLQRTVPSPTGEPTGGTVRAAPDVTQPPSTVATGVIGPAVTDPKLLTRGDALFANGDLASARLFYEQAAKEGDRQAALQLGETYDPAFLARVRFAAVRGDVSLAAYWYERALELGAPEAEILLKAVAPVKEQHER